MKKIMLVSTLVLVLLVAACNNQQMPTGNVVKEIGGEAKDPVEEKEEAVQEEKPRCSDECSADSCSGPEFIQCVTKDNGCKYKENKGKIKGKCGVECRSDSDCKSTEGCGDYKCVKVAYSMNENIKVDYLTYKITKAESFTKMGTSMFKKETNGKFIKVYLDMTNNAKETKEIFTPRFRLIDNQDRKFDRLSDDMMYIADYLEFGKQLQPGLTSSGAIVFEVPKDSTDLKLEIRGDWLSTSKVVVLLSNIKNIGKDTTQKDEVDEMMDEAMEEAEEQMEDLMNQCNSPFVCTSSCPEYMDVGQKNCPSGQVCCIQT